MLQEITSCLLCGTNNNIFFRQEDNYGLLKCGRCELVFLSYKPSEAELKNIYNCESGRTFHRLAEQSEGFEKRLEAKKRLGVVYKYLSGVSKILELGCGGGYLLELLKNRGYQVTGLEVSDELVSFARNTLKVDVRDCDVGDLAKNHETFDAVILFEVLSHLRDPLATLRDINKVLNDNGVLVIETGNGGEVEPDAQNKWGVPEHIYFFSRKSINILLSKCGFKIVKIIRFNVWWQRALLKTIASVKGKAANASVTTATSSAISVSPLRQFLRKLLSSILLFCRYEIGRIGATRRNFCSMIVIAEKSANI